MTLTAKLGLITLRRELRPVGTEFWYRVSMPNGELCIKYRVIGHAKTKAKITEQLEVIDERLIDVAAKPANTIANNINTVVENKVA